jgi:hypothetical protein
MTLFNCACAVLFKASPPGPRRTDHCRDPATAASPDPACSTAHERSRSERYRGITTYTGVEVDMLGALADMVIRHPRHDLPLGGTDVANVRTNKQAQKDLAFPPSAILSIFRLREELKRDRHPDNALRVTPATTGRTILFSAANRNRPRRSAGNPNVGGHAGNCGIMPRTGMTRVCIRRRDVRHHLSRRGRPGRGIAGQHRVEGRGAAARATWSIPCSRIKGPPGGCPCHR